MLQLQINEKGGQPRQESFDKNEITIGRVQGNDIILPKGNISKRHSRIVVKDGKFIIVDLKSTNGTYVNGKKITAPQVVKSTDKIYIGDFTIQMTPPGGAAERPASPRLPTPAHEGQEIDLFGGDAPIEAPSSGRAAGAPGLIDDNFDQEFDAPEAPQPKLPKPSRRAPSPKLPEPEPEPELELDADFDMPDPGLEPELDLDVSPEDGFDLDPEPEADFDPEPELEPEPEPELEPEPESEPTPRPSLLPKAKRAPRATPSRARPAPIHDEPEAPPPALLLGDDALGAPTMAPHLVEARTTMPAPAGFATPVIAAGVGNNPPPDRDEVLSYLHHHIVSTLGLMAQPVAKLKSHKASALQVAERAAETLAQRGLLPAGEHAGELAQAAAARAVDLHLIEDLLADDAVVELEITCDGQVLVDRDGRLENVERGIDNPAQVVELIHTLAALGGQEAGEDNPLVDVRLADGSRVVASLPPMAFRGPTLSVRKTMRDYFTLDKLLEYTTISQPMMTFIDCCIRFRRNILLSVGPGVGATATMNALLGQMPTDERLVSIENGIELHLGAARNLTSLEPRGGLDVSDLVRHAVAMQADRALIGGLDGSASAEVLRNLAGPLEGSVLAYSAPTSAAAVEGLARTQIADEVDGGYEEARRLVAQAFPVVLQEQRFLDNSRRITSVAEVVIDGDEVRVEEIFTFTPEGVDENLIVTGTFAATGYTPRFLEELVDRGEAEVDMSIFKA